MSGSKGVDRIQEKDKEVRTDCPLTVMEMFSRHPDKAVDTTLLVAAQTRQSVNTTCQHHCDLL